MTEFPLIRIEGAARDRGLQYGRAAGELIAKGVAFYSEEFARRGISVQTIHRICSGVRDQIAQYDPQSEIELIAMAEGAEQSVDDVLLINARTEVLNANHALTGAGGPAECSGIVALPERTDTGRILHGQNWDWLDMVAQTSLITHIREEDGPEILTLAEAGQLARSGMNKYGLALTANGLHTDIEGQIKGVCSPVIRRNILRQKSLSGAIGTVMQAPRNYSHNFMLSHGCGVAINLETTPLQVFWLKPENGVLVHTNHFKSPGALAGISDEGVRRSSDSLVREMLIERHMSQRESPIDLEAIKQAFMDRTDEPFGVLQPPMDKKAGAMESTVATIIMDPAQGRMWVSRTPYENADFQSYAFA